MWQDHVMKIPIGSEENWQTNVSIEKLLLVLRGYIFQKLLLA